MIRAVPSPLMVTLMLLFSLGTVTATADTQQSAGERIDDALLTARVKAVLVADKTTRAHQINIETFRGIIQLSGLVATESEKMQAGELAAGVRGVAEVRNAIEVRQTLAGKSAREIIDDAALTAKVKAALIADELTKAREINVES